MKTNKKFTINKKTKNIFIIFTLILICFFIVGFVSSYGFLTEMYNELLRLGIHSDLSSIPLKMKKSCYNGLSYGIINTSIYLYFYVLYELFSSRKKKKKIITGCIFTIMGLIFVISYFIAY
jgi:nitrate reductase NapE component